MHIFNGAILTKVDNYQRIIVSLFEFACCERPTLKVRKKKTIATNINFCLRHAKELPLWKSVQPEYSASRGWWFSRDSRLLHDTNY